MIEVKENERFNYLVVIKEVDPHRDKYGYKVRRFLCKCDCGNEKEVALSHLRKGTVRSCGCLYKGFQSTHGKKKTKEYRIWKSMKSRCNTKTHSNYRSYGGRGISVCDRWKNSFVDFLNDMGECPQGYSIERIDVNGNYEPANCKWIPLHEQQYNKRRHKQTNK